MKKRMVLLSALMLCGCMLIGAEPQMPHRKRSLRSRQLRIFNKAHQKRIPVIRDIRHGKLGKLTAAGFFRVD